MSSKKLLFVYIISIILAVGCLVLVWHFFRDQIVVGLGWTALFALVFGAGWVIGRFSRRKRE
ncbi:MAG: hypothetical protein IKL63_03730 [Alistipes sp.]|nr:hypothetical protein [Alistipes sp.]